MICLDRTSTMKFFLLIIYLRFKEMHAILLLFTLWSYNSRWMFLKLLLTINLGTLKLFSQVLCGKRFVLARFFYLQSSIVAYFSRKVIFAFETAEWSLRQWQPQSEKDFGNAGINLRELKVKKIQEIGKLLFLRLPLPTVLPSLPSSGNPNQMILVIVLYGLIFM